MERTDLPASLRKVLERAIREARIAAETGAGDSIRRLAVAAASPPSHLDKVAKDLRVRLRAHARSLGDTRRSDGTHEVGRLTEEVAYAHWHRLLFARFLLERRLLREPESGGEVSFDDCWELARAHGLPDAWSVAELFAASMLPGVFRPDDPALAVTFAPEHATALQRIVQSIDPATFQADDSLGWTYQFWRAAEKDAINKSGVKIGAHELPAVTQLFTEPYMVRFLLHNTLGAWWAGKVLAADPDLEKISADEATLRAACSLPGIDWEYLRFLKEDGKWRPAAGTFPGWPVAAKAITVLDPCCGSGHFLVEAFSILTALRIKEEKLATAVAAAAVLRDNLFGLEIDGRCVQLASFAIALAAWRLGGTATVLPNPHVAWVGAPPPLLRKDFVALANDNIELGRALGALHDLFVQAPLLGSLLRPTDGDLIDPVRLARIEEMLEPVIERARAAELERAEGAIAARGMADATAIFAQRYTLQATNVPFLGRGKQHPELAGYVARHFPHSKADLATVMLERMRRLCAAGGTIAAVMPQNWLNLSRYTVLRQNFLLEATLNMVGALGARAFETIGGEIVNVILIELTEEKPDEKARFAGFDANDAFDPNLKAELLLHSTPRLLLQKAQRGNPDFRITVHETSTLSLLSKYANAWQGIASSDFQRFGRFFWELSKIVNGWTLQQTTVDSSREFGGKEHILFWEDGYGKITEVCQKGATFRGMSAWGKFGVACSQINLAVTLYQGEKFDNNTCVITPYDERNLAPIWVYCASSDFKTAVRKLDRKLNVTNSTIAKVPFDLDYWQQIAAKQYPNGLPEPYSSDPTQWLFSGHPVNANTEMVLHVALARLAGYHWPTEFDPNIRVSTKTRDWIAKSGTLPNVDEDGLLCLPAVGGRRAFADRFRAFLATAFAKDWSDLTERKLLAETDKYFDKKPPRDASLEGWLRDRAFSQHCILFQQRPFLWHIWDGQKDGFAAIVNYHRLNRANLEKLTFSLLGDWISRMKAANDGRRAEAAMILQQSLQMILEGEKPCDIFVRWKPLAKQPLGWEPDLDDGVRINIRPFVEAEVLREVPNVKWTKDRGTDAKSAPWYNVFNGQRINDHHTTLGEKRKARGLK